MSAEEIGQRGITPRACVLVDCERPTWNGEVGEMCKGHRALYEQKWSQSIMEPDIEEKVAKLPVPPPSVDYVPDPEYVPPMIVPERPTLTMSVIRQADPGSPQESDTLAYLSDALEGRMGVVKRAQAEILVQLAADALRAL